MRRVVVVVVALILAGCAGAPADPDGGPADASAVPVVEVEADGVPQVLAFTAGTVGGGTFDGGDHAGTDLLMWFWAPW